MSGDIRDRVVELALTDLAFEGFTPGVLARAIQATGDLSAQIAFPRGPIDLARHYATLRDTALIDDLETRGLAGLKIRQKIATALKLRFARLAPEREIVRQSLALFARHPADGLAALHAAADAIWLACGDQATDFNHYTKRAILGSVIAATTLYWLQDDSEGAQATDAFIDRRIDNVMAFERTKAKINARLDGLPDGLSWLARARYAGRRPRG